MNEDEFMLVRVRDGAIVINRLILSDTGISEIPCNAHKANKELADSVLSWLESENRGFVSFRKIKK